MQAIGSQGSRTVPPQQRARIIRGKHRERPDCPVATQKWPGMLLATLSLSPIRGGDQWTTRFPPPSTFSAVAVPLHSLENHSPPALFQTVIPIESLLPGSP